MTCRPPLSLRNALAQADAIAPERHHDPESDGICADARHIAGGTSNHIPDARGVPHAVDVDDDPDAGYDAHYWAEQVRLRIKAGDEIGQVVTEIISDHRFTSARHNWDWVAYTGEDPHVSHAHYSIARTAFAENWTGSWWAGDEEAELMAAADDINKHTTDEAKNVTEREKAIIAKEVGDQAQKTRRVVVDFLDAIRAELGLDAKKVHDRLDQETVKILEKRD